MVLIKQSSIKKCNEIHVQSNHIKSIRGDDDDVTVDSIQKDIITKLILLFTTRIFDTEILHRNLTGGTVEVSVPKNAQIFGKCFIKTVEHIDHHMCIQI